VFDFGRIPNSTTSNGDRGVAEYWVVEEEEAEDLVGDNSNSNTNRNDDDVVIMIQCAARINNNTIKQRW
jgi:hypothetical protein